eukprot:CAMPEP_0182427172 /NCGR_PEP_ID=MMETSP1167-20130531/15136_1 /TAXON_ID=2988 /ORGANISM="Mallomonas Sp, Strain CCMP3275" /LENGTH=336 /DNA_ID=CAMNT_0024609179 /DNA_START=64 /DNA_END=1074 /DNA_ORIENTATION=+
MSGYEGNPLSKPKIADSIVDLIGGTPMVRLGKTGRDAGVVADIVLKLESMEPCSSVKDRIAKSMIEEAEKRGDINSSTMLIEPTSGNTGIGLAMVAAAKGYKITLVMPEQMSLERRVMLKALGANLVLTPAAKGMKGCIAKAAQIAESLKPNSFVFSQFSNPDNPKCHREGTGPEIWYQTDGAIDILIGGVGTGGTITGVSQFVKGLKPEMKTIAVEPVESPVLAGGAPGPHKIQGIGAGFVPDNCHLDLVDEIVPVSSDSSIETARSLATSEGIFVGISSGAAVSAAIKVGCRPENAGKMIVVVIPSFGERYLSTALFAELQKEAMAQTAEPVDL